MRMVRTTRSFRYTNWYYPFS